MGHSEMLLAVAGLDEDEIGERTRRLASGDWSSFTLAERAAWDFTRRLAAGGDAAGPRDFARLSRYFGPDRALDVLWWACRCHYMTRVADAFQLPLESENVFADRR
jgi:hypothetical protein